MFFVSLPLENNNTYFRTENLTATWVVGTHEVMATCGITYEDLSPSECCEYSFAEDCREREREPRAPDQFGMAA